MEKIITWNASSNNGAFQKQTELGVYSDLITTKPIFSFSFTDMEYVEQVDRYTIDGNYMNESQKAETLAYINALIIPIEWYKNTKKIQFSGAYQNAISTMIGEVDSTEMVSWVKQEAEARAWILDNTALTPVIDNLLIGRNFDETKQQLVDKIIFKADQYAVVHSQTLGQYHNKLRQLELCTTVNEVLALPDV